jgi:putative GTP pyrophosphokinase
MSIVYIKDYIRNKKESGYRSFHIIVEYPVQTALGMKPVLAEIQIRTLAMNFWATIEHSLNYKYRESVPEDVTLRLKRAAEAAYVLDQEMSNIRDEIMASQKHFEAKSDLVYKVLNDIQELYFYHRVREAAQFQLRFNELWEKEELWDMKELEMEIEQSLLRAKKEQSKS